MALRLHEAINAEARPPGSTRRFQAPTASQLRTAIGHQDAVVLVLSRAALASSWVNLEINEARKIEEAEGRSVLCPIAIDDAWKCSAAHLGISEGNLEFLKDRYNIADFSN